MLAADACGQIHERPDLLMLCAHGGQWRLPGESELIPLPSESELFMLPARRAVGWNPRAGQAVVTDQLAVAAFTAPAFTLTAHAAYTADKDAPVLPLFAYGAVGYTEKGLYVCARKVDRDPRQRFAHIPQAAISFHCEKLLHDYGKNRLIAHIINNCVRKYSCPAAKNFALGRYEAPLPTSRACSARCLGCISRKDAASPLKATPQCRLDFTPSVEEIVEIMRLHADRERSRPIYSFGQGCEGDPLANPELLAAAVACFRKNGGAGTINCNTNASDPAAVRLLCGAGLTSMRVSLNSARPRLYAAYYRPTDYDFGQVRESIRAARAAGVFVSLNLLFFPGISDTEEELAALAGLCHEDGVEMIQWRNLNIDPEWYGNAMRQAAGPGTPMGLAAFMKRLRKLCPWLRYGYFNPYVGEKASLASPQPGK